jgi:ABC-type sugar transport system ATPase subunit
MKIPSMSRTLISTGCEILLATRDGPALLPAVEYLAQCNRVIVMSEGQILANCTYNELEKVKRGDLRIKACLLKSQCEPPCMLFESFQTL